MSEVENTMIQELKRGIVTLGVLAELESGRHGYALVGDLESMGLQVDASTLYPLLRRLESQGLLESDWSVDGKRPRKYYHITPEGQAVRTRLISEWRHLSEGLELMIERMDNHDQT